METKKGLTGFHLKLIALITMAIDHTAAVANVHLMPGGTFPFSTDAFFTCHMYYGWMRVIGRMAFPIYCFLLVEGFHYTRDRRKYALLLLLFAMISEIPFDLAFAARMVDWSYNNVMWTLLLGLLMMWLIEVLKDRGKILVVVIIALTALVAELAHVDYGAAGIMAIALLYIIRERRMLGFALSVLILGLTCSATEFFALLMLIPIALYNGQRGRQIKYFFYAFYPAHLMILYVICTLVSGIG